VSILLRLTALVCLAWSVLLLAGKDVLFPAQLASPVLRGLANGLGIANAVLAYLFAYAARAPAANRGAVYAAIMLVALRTANDLYELLVLLPADRALLSLGDLVLNLALLVGLLEALPRTLGSRAQSPAP